MSRPSEPQGGDVAQAQAALQQMSNGYWATQIIYVAAKLGIADLLKDGPRGIHALAESTETHAPSLYRLMRALAGLGVFRENEAGEYETTALGRCLASGSPGALRARTILNGEDWYTGWGGLLHSVRTGETAFDHIAGRSFFEHLAANAEAAAVFNEAMASSTEGAARAVADAYDLSQSKTIVDVGGGTGAFLAGILQANPWARGVLFDRPNVVAAAGGLLTRAGVADRCDVVAGDFFEAVPGGGDVYILSWIIHDWDDDRGVTILKNCRRAMADNARLLVIEQVIPPGNQPSLGKLYDLHMLVLSGGRERREDEYRALLAAADLQLARIIPTDVPRSVIEALPR
ncbi:MAG: methyltransferase [Chloroflexi bacterium]|nr:methyltransferase [Chloroflexota bacterium]